MTEFEIIFLKIKNKSTLFIALSYFNIYNSVSDRTGISGKNRNSGISSVAFQCYL